MRTISEVFLVEEPITFAEKQTETGQPTTEKSTPTIVRISMEELELTYLHNRTVFNGINKIVQSIMSVDHTIEATNLKIKKYFTDFVENLGNSGSDLTWDELLETIYSHECIYGKSWIENIYNKLGNKIVDWDIIDPKKMDYAKSGTNKIVLDKFGRPVGYYEVMPVEGGLAQSVPTPPDIIKLGVSAPSGYKTIFVYPKQIAQLKLYNIGDGFYPVGLIEPIYKISVRKMNVEHGLANAMYRAGFPIRYGQVGDLNHEPTPDHVNGMLNQLKNLDFKNDIASAYYQNVKLLEPKSNFGRIKEALEYFNDQEISGLGIPRAFVTGSDVKVNKAAMENMEAMYQLTISDIIKRTVTSIRKYMFKPICELEEFKEIPTIKWENYGINELDRKAKRIINYIKSGALPPDTNIAGFLKKIEGIE